MCCMSVFVKRKFASASRDDVAQKSITKYSSKLQVCVRALRRRSHSLSPCRRRRHAGFHYQRDYDSCGLLEVTDAAAVAVKVRSLRQHTDSFLDFPLIVQSGRLLSIYLEQNCFQSDTVLDLSLIHIQMCIRDRVGTHY